MNLSPDDPRLTAYALGELPPNEAQEIEKELQKSPELRAAVDEIRQMSDLLKGEFAAEPGVSLSHKQKEAVVAQLPPENVVAFPACSFWRTAGLSAIAASILFVITWQLWTSNNKNQQVMVAQAERSLSPAPAPENQNAAAEPQPEAKQALEAKRRMQSADAPRDAQTTGSLARTAVAVAQDRTGGNQLKLPSVEGTEMTLADGSTVTVYHAIPEGATVASTQPVPATPAARQPLYMKGSLSTDANSLAKTSSQPGSYDQTIVAPPPVQRLPLVGTETRTKDKENASTVAGRQKLADLEQQNLPNHPKVVQQNKKVESAEVAGASAQTATLNYDSRSVVFYSSTAETDQKQPAQFARQQQQRSERFLSESKPAPGQPYGYGLPEESRHWYWDESQETARYPKYKENDFEAVLENPLSTFSIDVDTASYANVRRFLNEGRMPPKDAVRIEEMINYFSYDYPQPKGDEPFSVNMEVASCPWQPEHRLLRVGLKGKEMAQEKRPPSNFVFLIDVSGSMSPQERLPLIKQSLRMLVKRMTENDRIAIVVYASSSGVVLESTSAVNKEKILAALDRLEAGGSTNGGQGIQRAYELAEEHFIKGGVNRVILCTDGDFNVGITSQEELISLIQRKAKSGVFLTILGVGTDNYKDALMQKLADKGNGNYHYLDSVEEGHKVLVQQMNGTLVTIAKDVKIQIEFNPARVSSYRLIGYEKRIMAAEDFNNDKKDAGEIGAGHTVTALYEIVPAGKEVGIATAKVDELKYQKPAAPRSTPAREISGSNEMLTLKLRYKKPDGDKSILREHTLVDREKKFSQASTDFRFSASVASFGMILKDSEHKGDANFGSVLELARESRGDDKEGYRAEFINLVKKARELQREGADE